MTTLQSVQAILKKNFDLEHGALAPEARLEDLGIDSLAVIEVLFDFENEFGITVPSERVASQAEFSSVGDLVAYVDKLIAEQHPAQADGEAAP
jgi:acyl carrier protein